jgi:deoxyadenosine/deoxycytidine kinase
MTYGEIVEVEGIIGAGKTTAVRIVGAAFNLRPLFEPVKENPYLEDFYVDQKRYALIMQVELLVRRYGLQLMAAAESITPGGWEGAVLDRSLRGDRVFAKLHRLYGNIDDRGWATYENLFDSLITPLHAPATIVFLDTQPEIALERVQKRNRAAETNLQLEYLQDLRKGYLDLITEIQNNMTQWANGTEVVTVPWNSDYQPMDVVLDKLGNKFGKQPDREAVDKVVAEMRANGTWLR